VGTSSVRRTAQIRAIRDDLKMVDLRGNVDTRLSKLAGGEADAAVLALAGLQRLGREGEAGGVLDELVPAAGQGALALEARAGAIDPAALARVADPESTDCVSAERALVHALGASCNTPVGAYARAVEGRQVALVGWVGLPDGSVWLRDEVWAPADKAGPECAERMLAAGAADLLREAERVLAA
jgi:hydroxymethylbilane synthase